MATPRKTGKASRAPFSPTANPAYAAAMGELRRSNAAGTHADRRARRARTRTSAISRELRETS